MYRLEASTPSLHGLSGVRARQVAIDLCFRFLFAYNTNMPDNEKQRGALLIAASRLPPSDCAESRSSPAPS
jgi:hypothetical protein